jgi:hypothetical protein
MTETVLQAIAVVAGIVGAAVIVLYLSGFGR